LKLNKGSLFALFAVLELAGNADRQLSPPTSPRSTGSPRTTSPR